MLSSIFGSCLQVGDLRVNFKCNLRIAKKKSQLSPCVESSILHTLNTLLKHEDSNRKYAYNLGNLNSESVERLIGGLKTYKISNMHPCLNWKFRKYILNSTHKAM